jgi:hypothetical protein
VRGEATLQGEHADERHAGYQPRWATRIAARRVFVRKIASSRITRF